MGSGVCCIGAGGGWDLKRLRVYVRVRVMGLNWMPCLLALDATESDALAVGEAVALLSEFGIPLSIRVG